MLLQRLFIIMTLTCGLVTHAAAEQVRLAVAANFTAAIKEIAAAFEQQSGHQTLISFGSTGKLYAQILNNAPFDIFLAADQAHPRLLHQQGLGQTPVTYAVGKLVLWSADAKREVSEAALKQGDFTRLALANPKTAPYGAAAMKVMESLGLVEKLQSQWVQGDNIAQTYQFIATGNAELGFVALAQIALNDSGAHWLVPQTLYDPIFQDATLLVHSQNKPAALAFIEYLQSDLARDVIGRFGYTIEP